MMVLLVFCTGSEFITHNMNKEIIHIESGEFLTDCEEWWQNYVNLVWKNIDPTEEEFDKKLYDDWKIVATGEGKDYSPLTITFPSKEVYIQFLLTYS